MLLSQVQSRSRFVATMQQTLLPYRLDFPRESPGPLESPSGSMVLKEQRRAGLETLHMQPGFVVSTWRQRKPGLGTFPLAMCPDRR